MINTALRNSEQHSEGLRLHPDRLLSAWANCDVRAFEISSGLQVTFKFHQIDWDSHGIEEGGIQVCGFRGAGQDSPRSIIVEYGSMSLLPSQSICPTHSSKSRLVDDFPWLDDWVKSLE